MNRTVKVYTELDSLFDYRRGLVQEILTKNLENDKDKIREGDALWEKYCENNYAKRRLDNFEYPGLDIKHEEWVERFKKRSISDFLMFYPSNLPSYLFRKIIEIEASYQKPIDINGLTLYVNVFPYVLDEESQRDLITHLTLRFHNKFEIKILYHDPMTTSSSYYNQYQYVFKYDILTGPYEWFRRSLQDNPIPEVTFFVPDILVQEVDGITQEAQAIIFACSVSISPFWRIIPIEHHAYDYEKT